MAINPVGPKPTPLQTVSLAKLTADCKAALGGMDFSVDNPKLKQLDDADQNPARMKLVAKLPKAVQEAFKFYFKNVETNDWGSVSVYKTQVDGQSVYAVHTSTDGDDGFTEVFNFAGKRLATGLSGPKDDGKGGFVEATTWDAKLGDVRAKTIYE
jgi:hypothetical protein